MPANILVRPPANRASNGAQTIRQALGNVCRLSRINPVPRQYRWLINWGNTAPVQGRADLRVINTPEAIARAVDKIATLRTLQEAGVRVPEFSTDAPERGRAIWLARTNLRGSGGDGIVVVRRGDALPAAPLYVKYVPKREEYRLHVVNGVVVFAQQKRRKVTDAPEQTKDQKLIRNYDNGWVFCPVEPEALDLQLSRAAVDATAALGLDFAAVDMLRGRDDDNPYVLELNTAPGLESPGAIEAYTQGFRQLIGG